MTLIAHYPLQEDSGDAQDATGNGNTGTVNGPTQGATGILETDAYSFGGKNDRVETPVSLSSSFSVSVWTNFAGFTGDSGLKNPYNTRDGSSGSMLRFNNSSEEIEFFVYESSFNSVKSPGIPRNEWAHYTAVYEDSEEHAIYRDGVKDGSRTAGSKTGGQDLDIGDNPGQDREFKGEIADVRIYDHALTPSEVQYLYDVGRTQSYSSEPRTFSSAVKPKFKLQQFTLDGESCDVYIVGSPGTASEETQVVSLYEYETDYDVSWSNSHTEFQVRFKMGPYDDVTNRVEIGEWNLVTTAGTYDTDADWDRFTQSTGMVHDGLADNKGDSFLQHGVPVGSLTEGLIAYYPFDDSSTSSTAVDATPAGNDGTINGAVYNGSGKIGSDSLSFDGTDDFVGLPNLELSSSSDFTICCWVQHNQLPSTQGDSQFCSRFDGTDDILQLKSDDANDNYVIDLGHAGGTSLATNGGSVTTNYQHIAGLFESSGPTVRLYVDGVEVATNTGSVSDFATNNGPHIGARSDGTQYHAGTIDDVRIYDRALSPIEIEALARRRDTSTVTESDTT